MRDVMAQDKLKNLEDLKKLASKLPKTPGCYLFYGQSGEILYVGKAKNLRSRVGSYFSSDHKNSLKTKYLVEKIRDLSFELTESDAEAFVLENILIKKHRPKYNIRLKDDKSYPYIIVDQSKEFPSIEFRRRVKKDKRNLSFGPFVQGSNISKTLKEVLKAFGLRDCSDYEFNSRKEPCLLYQMHQCSGPCVGLINAKSYGRQIELASTIFRGRAKKAIQYLKNQMIEYSEREEFERALLLRDSLRVIEEFSDNYKEIASEEGERTSDIDLISYHLSDVEIDISIAIIRGGVHFGHKSFYFFKDDFEIESNLIRSIGQFYVQYLTSSSDTLPKKVFIQGISSDSNDLKKEVELSLERLVEKKIKLVGQFKKYSSLIELNERQAVENFKIRTLEKSSVLLGLKKLQGILSLREVPRYLECYDVAIFQGKSPTASQITFFDGAPDKKNYRHYHLEELKEGNNDFAMMHEVASRRVKKGKLPDVFIIDGGKGQVSSFLKGLGKGSQIPVVGIAKSKTQSGFKKRDIDSSEERLIIPGRKDSLVLPKGSALFRIITQMRDEAHRFSRRLHHHKESKKLTSSWLDQVNGIGEKTKLKILQNLKLSKSELVKLSPERISAELDVSLKVGQNILSFLQTEKS